MQPDLPEAFVERMQQLLGADAEALVRALARPSDTGLRVNTRKISGDRFRAASSWELAPIPWCPTGFTVGAGESGLGSHPLHLAGVYYLQDPSAMAVAEAVAAQPGDWVADLAAAPGGKATRLVEQIGRDGFLLANDVHPERALALGQNLERWGADNTVLARSAVAELAQAWGAVFDRVLLDAPCSGEGMFRKSDAAREMWSMATVGACAIRQSSLLAEAAGLVAPGGVLVYSTCTFAPEENETVAADFLRAHPEFTVERVDLPGLHPGRPDWVSGGASETLAGAARLWPHQHAGEGHFVVKMRRAGERDLARRSIRSRVPRHGAAMDGSPAQSPHSNSSHSNSSPRPFERRRKDAATEVVELSHPDQDLIRDFLTATLARDPYAERTLIRVGDQVYARPAGTPTMPLLKVIRPGLWLGTLRKKRFEPSHALALALETHEAKFHLDLDMHDPRLAAYLTGLEIEAAGDDGWILIAIDGFPLGWGKRVRGSVRNFYPKGLRLR